MNTKQAIALYSRLGLAPPPDILPSAEYIQNTRRKEVQGIQFRSTLEAEAWLVLQAWQQCGAITGLELQPKFLLQPRFIHQATGEKVRAMTYKADFSYRREDGERVVVEAKGFRTEPYKMRRKLFLMKFQHLVFEEWTRETMRGL